MTIGVSIVSFNTKELLRKCLQNLSERGGKFSIEVWVLDNNSEDYSLEMVKKEFPRVHIYKSGKNLGFSAGQNFLIKKILEGSADFVLLLNPDTEFKVGEIEKLAKFMINNRKCGIASGWIQDLTGRLQSNGGDLPFGLALINWLFNFEINGSLNNFHQQEPAYYQDVREVGWVGGTFMMIKREVFEGIGFLNEDYFMYFEDVEFCYRAFKAGIKIMIDPQVRIKHVSGASSKDPQYNQWKGEFKGLLKFYYQNYGLMAAFFVRMLIYLAVILRILAFAITGRFTTASIYKKVIYEL